jgi:hypothetical protein
MASITLMPSSNINKDLDSYLSSKRKRPDDEEDMDEEQGSGIKMKTPGEAKKEGKVDTFVIDTTEDDLPEEQEEVVEESKPTVVARFQTWLKGKKDDDEFENTDDDNMDEETDNVKKEKMVPYGTKSKEEYDEMNAESMKADMDLLDDAPPVVKETKSEQKVEQVKETEKSFDKELEDLEHEEEKLEEEDVEIKRKENRVWSKMASIFRKKIPEETKELDADFSRTREDLKLLAQITTRVLEKLPSHLVHDFKASKDYHDFVDVLERNGFAKRIEKKNEGTVVDEKSGEINIYKLGDSKNP